MRRLFPIVTTAFIASASMASAATFTTVTIGDDDCFGLNVACPIGIGLPPTLPLDSSGGLDPDKQDIFGEIGTASFEFALDLTDLVVSNVEVTAKFWGLDLFATSPANGGTFGDDFEGARIQVNGTDVGTYFSAPTADGLGPVRVETVMFDVMADTLVTGTNTITIIPEQDFLQFAAPGFSGEDAYAIDFVTLSFESENAPTTAPVPLPAGLPLLIGALGLLGYSARQRRR
ncbi:MAG: hypothetical protein AAGI09_00975 [Pseudomonadota bacterium]